MNPHKHSSPAPKSSELYNRACDLLPGGVSRNTVFRRPHPHYVASAKGCYVTDIDGVQRIDFANNMASLIHGHAHPDIVRAVTEQIKKGTAYTLATEAEYQLAHLLCSRAPAFEKIRFVNSGTEAVMTMIKAARAFTGRPKIAKAEGAYHGTYDFAEVSQYASPKNWGDINRPNSVPLALGTPKSVLDDVLIFPYNDVDRTLAILDKFADEIACVVIDPIPHRVGLVPGSDQFIEALHDWCRRNGALFVFDEVITFRINYGGAQEKYTVKPDLSALGKIIGGGFPVGALTGRADVMEVLNPQQATIPFPHSGTFSANPVSMTAGRVAMELYDAKSVADLNALTAVARDKIDEAIKVADVPVSVTGVGSMFRVHLKATPPMSYREAYLSKEEAEVLNDLLDYLFLEEKLIMINTCSCMFSTALQEQHVDRLAEALLNGFRHIKRKLEKLAEKKA